MSYYKLISILYYFIDISPASDCVRRVFVDRNNLKYDRNVMNEYICQTLLLYSKIFKRYQKN